MCSAASCHVLLLQLRVSPLEFCVMLMRDHSWQFGIYSSAVLATDARRAPCCSSGSGCFASRAGECSGGGRKSRSGCASCKGRRRSEWVGRTPRLRGGRAERDRSAARCCIVRGCESECSRRKAARSRTRAWSAGDTRAKGKCRSRYGPSAIFLWLLRLCAEQKRRRRRGGGCSGKRSWIGRTGKRRAERDRGSEARSNGRLLLLIARSKRERRCRSGGCCRSWRERRPPCGDGSCGCSRWFH